MSDFDITDAPDALRAAAHDQRARGTGNSEVRAINAGFFEDLADYLESAAAPQGAEREDIAEEAAAIAYYLETTSDVLSVRGPKRERYNAALRAIDRLNSLATAAHSDTEREAAPGAGRTPADTAHITRVRVAEIIREAINEALGHDSRTCNWPSDYARADQIVALFAAAPREGEEAEGKQARPPTEDEIDAACKWYDSGFATYGPTMKDTIRRKARQWLRAWCRVRDYEIPAPPASEASE